MTGIKSEKDIYKDLLPQLDKINFKQILWGEDLVNYKLVIYPQRITDIPYYNKISKNMVSIGIVYINPGANQKVKPISVMLNWSDREIYIEGNTLHKVWKYLRTSVQRGIDMATVNRKFIRIVTPEDILVTKYIKMAKSDFNKMLHLPEKGRMNNVSGSDPEKDYIYYYARDGKEYHDKDCEKIRNMMPETVCTAKSIPIGIIPCPKCQKMLYLRELCNPFYSDMKDVDRILTRGKIDEKQVKKLINNYGMRMHTDIDGNLIVPCNEDVWKIEGLEHESFSLWHNNYVRTGQSDRKKTSGYHIHEIRKTTLEGILKYISGYSFEKHLEAETL